MSDQTDTGQSAGGGTQANGTTSGKRQWPDWAALLETAKRVAFNVVIIAAIAVGVPVFVKLVTTRGVVINDITVPSAVADRGLTSDVISRRILDQLHEIKIDARAKKEQEAITGTSTSWSKPTFWKRCMVASTSSGFPTQIPFWYRYSGATESRAKGPFSAGSMAAFRISSRIAVCEMGRWMCFSFAA